MLGRDKNRSTITQKTKIKESYTVPASQVRQQIRQGTSLIGGTSSGQYTNAQQFVNQQGYTIDPNHGYTQDPYLKNLPGEQQFANYGSNLTKVERKIEEKFDSSIGGQNYGNTMMPVQNSGFGTSMPVGTSGIQRRRSSSSSSSQKGERNKMSGNWANLRSSNVETLGPNLPYQPNTYVGDLPIQQGNIQTGYGSTVTNYDVVNPIESTLYRSSTDRKGLILGKNLYGETGYASSGYSIQQPFPGQNVYLEEDPAKISENTKEKFERSSIM